AHLVDVDVALALVGLALVALPLVVGGGGQRLEHDHVGMITARLRRAGLGDELARGRARKRRLADAALAREDPAMVQPRPGERRLPFAPRLVVAEQRHRRSPSRLPIACMTSAWVSCG